MRKSRLLIGVTLGLGAMLAASTASAAMLKGRDLSQCGTTDERCAGYIMGVIDQSGWLEAHLDEAQKCLPGGVSTADLMNIVTGYLASHQDAQQMPAPQVVDAAIKQALAC